MNRYIEKIAGMVGPDATVGRVDKPAPIVSPGSKLTSGAKSLFNRALYKAAEQTTGTKDAINTGVIGTLGAGAGFGANKAMNAAPKIFGEGARFHNTKLLAVSGAAGLAAGYAGIKLNKVINKHVK
jgi:hypothetical protein